MLGLKCLSFRELIHANKGLDVVNSDRENLRTSQFVDAKNVIIPENKQQTSINYLQFTEL